MLVILVIMVVQVILVILVVMVILNSVRRKDALFLLTSWLPMLQFCFDDEHLGVHYSS